MASLDIQKVKAGQLAGLSKHYDEELRLKLNHSNNHINKELTTENMFINCSSYQDGLQKLNKCIKEIDEKIPPKRVRADRVTMAAIEIPIPDEISQKGREAEREFSLKAINWLKEELKVPEIIGFVHVDERHTYTDPITHKERMSLSHIHSYVPAYTEEKGINAKNFFGVKRLNYSELNKKFNRFVQKEYDIQYLNGNEYLNEPVETLKKISEAAKKHDNELMSELEFHKEIIKEGGMLKIETKSALGNNVKISNDDFNQLMKDVQYASGTWRTISKIKKEKETLERECRKKIEEIKKECNNRISIDTKNYQEMIKVRDKAIKLFCDLEKLDYDKITNAIEISRGIGHENAYKKAILKALNKNIPIEKEQEYTR